MALRDKIKKGAGAPKSVAPPKMPDALSEPPAPLPAAPAEKPAPVAREEPPQTTRSSPAPEQPAPRPRESVRPPQPPPARASAQRMAPPPMPVEEKDDKTPLPGPLPSEEEDSGAIRVSESELVDSAPQPAAQPKSVHPLLADVDLSKLGEDEEPSQAPPEPQATVAERPSQKEAKASEPPAPKEAKAKKRTWAFDAENDEGASFDVASGVKLKYMDRSANGLQFRLKGKDAKDFELNLDESATVSVDSVGGPISVTVKNKGLNGEGKMEIEIGYEGGVSKASKAAETVQKAASATGKKTVSAIVAHNAEIAIGAIAAAIPVVFYAVGGHQLREAMGSALYYIGGTGVPVVMGALAIWQGMTRRKDMQADAGNTPAEAKN
jgi:hypothetical protein